ncbi:hypothetical protein CEXT_20101 [Caerostris extrusa]|uniref:Uncharacterized protein n=1 Tax=Caerostris extrusa TaxID=172846 RepID=A0AAV4PZ15_CAEEX|nr:hypothetical protein CEXT_20101 [Caerostris extrusa]
MIFGAVVLTTALCTLEPENNLPQAGEGFKESLKNGGRPCCIFKRSEGNGIGFYKMGASWILFLCVCDGAQ